MNSYTQDYCRVHLRQPKKPYKGLDAAVNQVIGWYRRRGAQFAEMQRQVVAIERLAGEYVEFSDFQLQDRLKTYRQQFRRPERVPAEVLAASLAAIREASDRELGLRPYPVQLLGALGLYRGNLIEMATGEGKTLTAGLAGVLAGWSKRPCHVVTVNDYLVERDAEWLRPLYHFCSVKVGHVAGAMNPRERRHGYECDVTYVTSKELLADFLRDRIQQGLLVDPTRRLIRTLARGAGAADNLVMRGLHTAIVDEADSVLIDEAVTPLIISTQHKNELLREVVVRAKELVEPFEPGRDYDLDARYREVELTPDGVEKLEELCSSLPGLWRGTERRLELVKQALVAREFYLPGKQYIINEGKIVIVDEFTGRAMPQRTWREGMHQAIEAKEGLEISDPSETIARMSFQRFFRLFQRLSGMTGTAWEAADEFWQIYQLPVLRIPTNKPCIRVRDPDRIFPAQAAKWTAVVADVLRLHQTRRPVLIGTRSVAASEHLAARLTEQNVEFKLLNAAQHKDEAEIVAIAGHAGRITIATNMAGRGTDIKLGHGVRELGGLHVLATERHESGRVDRQLFGRSARQGDPGSAQAFVAADDELVRRHLPQAVQKTLRSAVEGKLPAARTIAEGSFALAQSNAQRLAFRQRKGVLASDAWLEEALSFAGPDQ